MKAPDNIFIDESRITELGGLLDAIVLENRAEDSDICYIRKDAILDKLKIQQDKCVYRSTYWDFYQAIITEIKAL